MIFYSHRICQAHCKNTQSHPHKPIFAKSLPSQRTGKTEHKKKEKTIWRKKASREQCIYAMADKCLIQRQLPICPQKSKNSTKREIKLCEIF